MINLEFIINMLSLGSLYAMLALGLVIVYGILRLVNSVSANELKNQIRWLNEFR